MVAEVHWIDGRALVKCWAPTYYERSLFNGIIFKDVYQSCPRSYSNEIDFYLTMKSRHPDGHELFPTLYGYGEIIISVIFPAA